MSPENSISLIVALKGSKDVEKEGKIIHFKKDAKLNTVYNLAAEKLSIIGSRADLQLWNEKGELLGNIDSIKDQHVVYVDVKQQIKDVPHGYYLPFVGSLYEMLPDVIDGFIRQFDTYGPLVEVNLLGTKIVTTNDPEYAEIFVKESEYFTKKVTGEALGLAEFREFAGQGLFTSDTDELDWKLAHKLLMPAFSPRAIKIYQHEMGLITQQLIRILDQYSPDEPVEILDWTTNVTFETIGRVGFGYDFKLLTDRNQPPNDFIQAMSYCLRQAMKRIEQFQFMKYLPLESNRKFDRSVKLMHSIVDEVIIERKNSPDAKNMEKDLLGYMLNARDEHNLGLSDENIRDQVVTFLIAGHDTTANTLAWALYNLSRNPDIMAKVLQEIADNHITWDTLPSPEQISNLKYLHQVLKETLRMYPPVDALGKYCREDCILPGGYKVKATTSCIVHVYAMHHNEKIYPDSYRFDPDRWTPEEEQKRSRSAFLSFSTGPRGCIGMALALQEAKTVLAMLLNKYDLRYDGPDIQYDPKAATIKPVNLFMNIHPRKDFPNASAEAVAAKKNNSVKNSTPNKRMPVLRSAPSDVKLPPITFLFGTQTGTAQDYANQLANQAKSFGFKDVTLCEMDKWKVLADGKFISDDTSSRNDKELVVICTATYNGQPPDSAENFDKFLDHASKEDDCETLLNGLSFAVFGLGNRNWRTYQQFPIKVSSKLEELGAERLFASGEGDVDKDMDAEFNEWSAHFWTYTLESYGVTASEAKPVVPTAATSSQHSVVKVEFIQPSDKEAWATANNNQHGENNATIYTNRELQKENSPRSTRHIEVDISKLSPVGDKDLLYNAGDHLEIFPENNKEDVEAVALNFGWVLDSVFKIDEKTLANVSPRSLAANIKGPCTIRNMLTYYADITSPPSRGVLACFGAKLKLTAPETAETFIKLLMPDSDNQDQYPAFIQKHRTLLDLQRAYPQVNGLDLGQFLASVPVIQPRRYSIASSPLAHPKSAHLTIGVVDDVVNDKHYSGLASSFMKHGKEGATLRAALKSCKSTFNMPHDPSVPLILISAGTGISPFRGFLQERKVQKEKCDHVGETVLFFGCRREDQDYIYQEELEAYVNTGVISQLHVAFSRSEKKSPIKYVQHALVAHASEIWNLICPTDANVKPAAIYICGSGAMSREVRSAFANMAISFGKAANDKEAEKFIDSLTDEKRFLCDVWG